MLIAGHPYQYKWHDMRTTPIGSFLQLNDHTVLECNIGFDDADNQSSRPTRVEEAESDDVRLSSISQSEYDNGVGYFDVVVHVPTRDGKQGENGGVVVLSLDMGAGTAIHQVALHPHYGPGIYALRNMGPFQMGNEYRFAVSTTRSSITPTGRNRQVKEGGEEQKWYSFSVQQQRQNNRDLRFTSSNMGRFTNTNQGHDGLVEEAEPVSSIMSFSPPTGSVVESTVHVEWSLTWTRSPRNIYGVVEQQDGSRIYWSDLRSGSSRGSTTVTLDVPGPVKVTFWVQNSSGSADYAPPVEWNFEVEECTLPLAYVCATNFFLCSFSLLLLFLVF